MINIKESVYQIVKEIPYGKVATYSQIAEKLGNKNLCRVVGNILHNNPNGEEIPCYKVVNSQGRLSYKFAFGGIEGQRAKLQQENIIINGDKIDLNIYKWQ